MKYSKNQSIYNNLHLSDTKGNTNDITSFTIVANELVRVQQKLHHREENVYVLLSMYSVGNYKVQTTRTNNRKP